MSKTTHLRELPPHHDNPIDRFEHDRRAFAAAAAQYKRWYLGMQTFVLFAGGISPIILMFTDWQWKEIAAAGISLTSTLCMGLSKLFRFQENWNTNHEVAEALLRERMLFLYEAGPYRRSSNPTRQFVERVERIKTNELKEWHTDQHHDQDSSRKAA